MTSVTHTVNLNRQQQETAIIAMEEMAELTQVLSKLIRFGYTPEKRVNLIQEIGDVRCMIELLHNTFGLLYNDTDEAKQDKQIKLMAWSKIYE